MATQGNWWDQYEVVSPAAGGPIVAPPDPYKQAALQEQVIDNARADQAGARADAALDLSRQQFQYRQQADMRPDPGKGYQLNPDGTATPVAGGAADKVAEQRRNALSMLNAAGVDIANNVDPVADLIAGSTSGWLQTGAAKTWGAVTGDATDGMENISKLKTIASDLTLQMTGGSLGAQVSNSDREFIVDRIGNIADPTVPADARLAAWEQVKQRMASIAGLEPPATTALPNTDTGAPEGEVLLGYRRNEDGSEYPIYGQPPQGGGSPPPPSGDGGGFFGVNSMSELGQGISQGASSLVKGAAALPGMIIDPVGQALYDATGYGDHTYNTGQILSDAFGLSNNTTGTDEALQFAGSALTGAGAARSIASIAAPGIARNALEVVGRTPIRDTVAGLGAGAGMAAGRESGIPGGEIGGALIGGLAGYGGANALAGLGGQRGATPLLQAADRQRVQLLPADAGGPVARAVTTGTRASPLSVGPVVRQAQAQQGQMRDATRRAVENQGGAVDTDLAGEAVRGAAERYTRNTSARASRLYDRANQQAQGVQIRPQQTIGRLDEYIARVQADPSAPPSAVSDLQRFRQNIENGVSVSGLRDARSRLSQGVYDGQLRSGAETAMWKDILSNLSTDIDAGLRQAGRTGAANQFKRADEFWKGRVEHIDQVLQPILGRDKSGEDIVSAIESMTRGGRGGNARLSRLLGEMTPDEAMNVRATVIDRLGRANPGAQNAEGTAYSSATFLTNWNKMTPQAKASLFPESQLRRDLNDIAQLADGMKQSQSMANFSNTGIAVGANAGLGAAAFMANPALALTGAGAQYLTGRLMASPKFARLLARTAKMAPAAANRSFTEQLGVLAAQEPVIANDIQSVQRFLSEAGAQSPGRIAAREDEGNRGPVPPQQ